MSVKLLTEHDSEFLSLKRDCTGARLSPDLSKCHIVENHMPRLIIFNLAKFSTSIVYKVKLACRTEEVLT